MKEKKNDKSTDKNFLMDKLIDLMLTFPTLLIIQNRKEEAVYCIERCIVICEKYQLMNTKAILTLMMAGIFLNDKHREYSDVWEKARNSLNLFIDLKNIEGKAEANFLLGML